jgi:TRAP-type C4-dicarboxylate transport system permease small subunit
LTFIFIKEQGAASLRKNGGDAFKARWKAMRLRKLINSGIPFFCGVLFLVMVVITFLQIVLREGFNFTFNWSDEVAQFCMMWLVCFGSIWATINAEHLTIGIKLHEKLPEWQVCLIDGILALVILVTVGVVVYQSAIVSFSSMGMESLSLHWLKMGYVFIALPFTMLVVCFYYLKSFLKNLARIFKRD